MEKTIDLILSNQKPEAKPLIERTWNENGVQTTTQLFLAYNQSNVLSLAIQKDKQGVGPMVWQFPITTAAQLKTMKGFFQSFCTIFPALGCYHYWSEWAKNRNNNNGGNNNNYSNNNNNNSWNNNNSKPTNNSFNKPGPAPNTAPAGQETFGGTSASGQQFNGIQMGGGEIGKPENAQPEKQQPAAASSNTFLV